MTTAAQPSVPPPAAAGERCRNGDQKSCQAGLYCASPMFSAATSTETCAICAPLPGAGQPCGDSYHCAAGLYCRPAAATDPDRRGVCQEFQAGRQPLLQRGRVPLGLLPAVQRRDGAVRFRGDRWRALYRHAGLPVPVVLQSQQPVRGSHARYGVPCTANDQCASPHLRHGFSTMRHPGGWRLPIGPGLPHQLLQRDHPPVRHAQGARRGLHQLQRVPVGRLPQPGLLRTLRIGPPLPGGRSTVIMGPSSAGRWESDGAVCDDDDQCQSRWCNSSDRCATKPDIGDTCPRSSDCYPAGVLHRRQMRAAPGARASCSAPDSCQEPFLCRKGHCELINLACAPARTGSMCAYLRICEASAYCDFQDAFTCKPRQAAGRGLPADQRLHRRPVLPE